MQYIHCGLSLSDVLNDGSDHDGVEVKARVS